MGNTSTGATAPRTINPRRTNKTELDFGRKLYPDNGEHDARPLLRSECRNGPRPCPWVSCEHHLFLDVKSNGSIVLNFPDLDPWELEHSCALDLAESGDLTLEEIGELFGLTRERVRQLELSGLRKVRDVADEHSLRDFAA